MNFDKNRLKDKIFGLKGVASIGFGDIVGSGITAIFWFYIASLVETEQYGEIHYLLGIAGIAFTVSQIGNPHVITVLTAKKAEINPTLYLLSLIIASISVIVVFVLILRPEPSFVVLGYIIGALVLAELLGRNLYKLYAKYVLSQKILTVILGLMFFHLIGIEGILYAIALSHLPFVGRFIQEFRHTKIDFKKIKNNLNFISNNYILVLADGFRNNLDKLIIVPLLGFSVLGNYSISLQVITVLMIFSNIIFKFILPQDAQGNPNKKLKLVTIFFAVGFSLIGIFILPLIVPIFFPKYIEAIDAIRIMSIAVISSTISLLFWSKFLGMEKSNVLVISRTLMVITMITGVLTLGQFYGIIGIAITFVISSIVEAVFLFIINRKIMGVKANESRK